MESPVVKLLCRSRKPGSDDSRPPLLERLCLAELATLALLPRLDTLLGRSAALFEAVGFIARFNDVAVAVGPFKRNALLLRNLDW